jgi:LysR family transcriptional activator of nhaA
MEWLNYHHLRYFWAVARDGGVTRASETLHVSQPTVSAQIRALEDALGEKLLARKGRSLALTDAGRVVFRYADEIFGLGRELLDTVKGRPTGRPTRLVVGIADAVPKLIAYRLLEPALRLPEPVRIVCNEDRLDRLLAELALHGLDLVIADSPARPAAARVRVFTHLLGESPIAMYAKPSLAKRYKRGFPDSLTGAPLLLPTASATLRRMLDHWLDARDVRPRVIGEFEDSALMKAFGQAGLGVFPSPQAIEDEIRGQYGVEALGTLDGITERFYAISVERRIKHPGLIAISNAARRSLFA